MTIRPSNLTLLAAAIGLVVTTHPVAAQENRGQQAVTIPPPAPPARVLTRPPAPPVRGMALEVLNQEPGPAHFELVDAIEQGVDQGLALENMLAAARSELAANADMAMLEETSPGLIVEVTESMRPALLEHTKRLQALYVPRMAGLFARYLTPEEAGSVAEFYRSDLGRRLLKMLSRNYTADAIFENYETTSEITRDQLDRDMGTTVATTLGQLSPEELAEMEVVIRANPATAKMSVINVKLRALKLEMENQPMTPETERAMQEAMQAVFNRRFPQ